jgi:hypothetical protein
MKPQEYRLVETFGKFYVEKQVPKLKLRQKKILGIPWTIEYVYDHDDLQWVRVDINGLTLGAPEYFLTKQQAVDFVNFLRRSNNGIVIHKI